MTVGSTSSVTHATFVIERTFPSSPDRVFAAFADPATKKRWFVMPAHWEGTEHALDFRVGGREVNRGGPPSGRVHTFDARFHEIVENERIVYAYDLSFGDVLVSVSLVTIELSAAAEGTRMTFTEHGAFLDGHDDPAGREHGTHLLLDAVAAFLEQDGAGA